MYCNLDMLWEATNAVKVRQAMLEFHRTKLASGLNFKCINFAIKDDYWNIEVT